MQEKYLKKNVLGKTFNFLKVKELLDDKKSPCHCTYLCICVCGEEFIGRCDYIVNGDSKSCGCKKLQRKFGKEHCSFKGCGEIGLNYFNRLKEHAGYRNHSFNITIEYIWNLFLEQERKCAITDWPLQFSSRKLWKNHGIEQTASLDRIDPSKGYEIGNVQWVHKDTNRIKQVFTEQRLFEFVTAAYNGPKYKEHKIK